MKIKMDDSRAKSVGGFSRRTRMKLYFGTSRTTQAITGALIGLVSFAVLGGCAMGKYPAMAQVATVPVGAGATPAVIPALLETLNPTTGMLYISDATASAVYVFDVVSNTVVATIPIGVKGELAVKPGEIAVNSVTNTIYVIAGDGSIYVIDGRTNVIASTISSIAGPASRIAVDSLTNRIYISTGVITYRPGNSGANNNFLVLDGVTQKLIGGLALSPSCIGLAVDAQTNTIYATTYRSVEIIDGNTNRDMASIPSGTGDPIDSTGKGDLVDVAVDETTHTAYAVQSGFDSTSNRVFVIDGATYTKTGAIALASAPYRVAVGAQTDAVYVTLSPTDLAIIDGASEKIVHTVSFSGGPTGVTVYPLTDVAVNPVTGLVYATQGSDLEIITPAPYATKDVSVVP